jgi:RimJ/RimL family protein N-acetyltransferase
MTARGKRAVWGAHASNAASLRVAEKLGFQQAQHIWTARRPADEDDAIPDREGS